MPYNWNTWTFCRRYWALCLNVNWRVCNFIMEKKKEIIGYMLMTKTQIYMYIRKPFFFSVFYSQTTYENLIKYYDWPMINLWLRSQPYLGSNLVSFYTFDVHLRTCIRLFDQWQFFIRTKQKTAKGMNAMHEFLK